MSRTGEVRNVAASVRARLRALAGHGDQFQLLVRHYGLERFLYRLSRSPHGAEFILKGAMLFRVWNEDVHRPTYDVDLLGMGERSLERLVRVFQEVCRQDVEADGLVFLEDSVRAHEIREDQAYGGVRVLIDARLENIRIPIQVDVGFRDVVTPRPDVIQFPGLLPVLPLPTMRAYPRETVVAEKFEAMVNLGATNSRMKDFFDVWTLCREFAFEGATLAAAIRATFQRRATALPEATPVALTDAFSHDASKRTQWNAFLRKGRLDADGAALDEVVAALRRFLAPPLDALRAGAAFDEHWPPGGPWSR